MIDTPPMSQSEQRGQRLRRLEGFFDGLDSVDAKVGPRFTQVIERAPDPAEARAQAVNKAFLTYTQPQLRGAIGTRWEAVRAATAQALDHPNPAAVTDKELYGLFAGKIRARNERRMLTGEVLAKVQEAAMRGEENWLAVYSQAEDAIQDLKPEEGDALRLQGQAVWEHAKARVAVARPAVEAGVAYYTAAVEGGVEMDEILQRRKAFEALLTNLNPEDRALALNKAIDLAAASTGKQRAEGGKAGFAEKAAVKLERAIGEFPRSIARTWAISRGDKAEGEAEELRRQIDSGLADAVDPVAAKNRLVNGIYDALESVPYMATAALPWVGIPLTIAALADDARAQFEAQGISTADATVMGMVAAVPQAAIERLQANLVFGKIPGLKGYLAEPAKTFAARIGKVGAALGVNMVAQNFEEAAQDITPLIVQEVWSKWAKDIPGVKREQLEEFATSRVDTFFAMLPLVLVGGGVSSFRSVSEGRKVLGDRTLLAAAGLTRAQANSVIKALDSDTLEDAETALRTAFETKGPADTTKLDEKMANGAEKMGQVVRQADGTYMALDADGGVIGPAKTAAAAGRLIAQHEGARKAEEAAARKALAEKWTGSGVPFDGMELGEVEGKPAVRFEDGTIEVIDVSVPEQAALLTSLQTGQAAALKEAEEVKALNEMAAPTVSDVDAESMDAAMGDEAFPKIEEVKETGEWLVTSPDGEVIGSRPDMDGARDLALSWFDEQARAEERAAAQEEAGQTEDNELLNVVQRVGGIPAVSNEETFGGELRTIRESLGTAKALRLFRKSAKDLDYVREAVNEQGFAFETVTDFLDALDRAAKGERMFGNKVRESMEPQELVRGTPDPDADRALGTGQAAITAWAQANPDAPAVTVIHDPDLTRGGFGVGGYYQDGKIVVNTAFARDPVATARHEWAHSLLDSNEGRTALADFGRRFIPDRQLSKIREMYPRREGVDDAQHELDLIEEWVAKNAERAPGVLRRMVDAVREWLAKHGMGSLTNEEAARAMLRALRKGKEAQRVGGEARASLVDAPAFYSRITRTVEQSPQGKATGAQWKATIANSKLGVNRDELALASVADLEDGKVYTKAEVLDYLRANEVTVEDVTLGAPKDGRQVKPFVPPAPLTELPEGYELIHDSRAENGRQWGIIPSDRSYAQPSNGWHATPEAATAASLAAINEDLALDARAEWEGSQQPEAGRETHFSTYTLPGAKEGSYREVLLTVPTLVTDELKEARARAKEYREIEERMDEIGRDLGLRKGTEEYHNLYHTNEEWRVLYDRLFAMPASTARIDDVVWRDGHSQYSQHANPIVRLRFNERETADGKRVLFLEEVQAPQPIEFTKMPALFQKNWREIGFKWAIRHASEKDMDAVAWTTGDQQAERYDLSKHLEEVSYAPGENGKFYVSATSVSGERVIDADLMDLAKIEETLGKELAQKIARGEGEARGPENSRDFVFSGLDLKVGGEGLRKLYDVDFRNVVNGLPVVKKAGQKVGTVEVGMGNKREGARMVDDGAGGLVPVGAGGEKATVPALTLTPAIRAAAMQGQARFSLTGPSALRQEAESVLRKRRISERVQDREGAAAVFAPEVGAALRNTEYQAMGLGQIRDGVMAIMARGVDVAEQRYNDPLSSLTVQERVGLGMALSEVYNRKGDFDRAAGFVDSVAQLGTSLGQAVNAFKLLGQMLDTPQKAQAFVARQRKKLNAPPKGIRRTAGTKLPDNVPELTPEQNEELAKLAERVGRTPKGSVTRADAAAELLGFIDRSLTGISTMDLAWSIWYGGILSGYNTHIRNVAGNTFEFAATAFLDTLARSPGQWWDQAVAAVYGTRAGFDSGIREGVQHFKEGGSVIGRTDTEKFGPQSALEQKRFAGGRLNPYNYIKYAQRLLVAEDAVNFTTAYELKATQIAHETATAEGLEGEAHAQRVAELLNQTDLQQQTFTDRAAAEWDEMEPGDTKATREEFVTRRVRELTQQERDGELVERATSFANRVTFNYKPEGVLGVMAELVGIANRGLSNEAVVGTGKMGKALKGVSQATRLIVPFTRIVANVTNRQLDYLIGVPRSAFGRTFTLEGGRVVPLVKDMDERRVELAKGLVGWAAGVAIAKALAPGDDDDGYVKLHGSGPASAGAKRQLEATGWKAFSLQIGGTYYTYRYLPIGIMLATIGELHDHTRYAKDDETSTFEKIGFMLAAAGAVTLDASFLSNAADFLAVLNEKDDNARGAAFERFVGRTVNVSPFIPFSNLFNNITGDLDEFDRDRSGIRGWLGSQVPVAQLRGQPAINLLGDFVENRFFEAFVGRPKVDEESQALFRLLAEKNAWLSSPVYYRNKMDPEMYYRFQQERGKALKQMLRENAAGLASMDNETAQAGVRRLNALATRIGKAAVNYVPKTQQAQDEEMKLIAATGTDN